MNKKQEIRSQLEILNKLIKADQQVSDTIKQFLFLIEEYYGNYVAEKLDMFSNKEMIEKIIEIMKIVTNE